MTSPDISAGLKVGLRQHLEQAVSTAPTSWHLMTEIIKMLDDAGYVIVRQSTNAPIKFELVESRSSP